MAIRLTLSRSWNWTEHESATIASTGDGSARRCSSVKPRLGCWSEVPVGRFSGRVIRVDAICRVNERCRDAATSGWRRTRGQWPSPRRARLRRRTVVPWPRRSLSSRSPRRRAGGRRGGGGRERGGRGGGGPGEELSGRTPPPRGGGRGGGGGGVRGRWGPTLLNRPPTMDSTKK